MRSISIGRDESCDVVIIDRTNVVSRRHAVITIDNFGRMTITDYSSNGTYINGIRMTENVAVPINRKDTISFARVIDLDWNTIPDIKSRNIKISIITAVVISAIAIILCIIFDNEKTGQNSQTPEITIENIPSDKNNSHEDVKPKADDRPSDIVERPKDKSSEDESVEKPNKDAKSKVENKKTVKQKESENKKQEEKSKDENT